MVVSFSRFYCKIWVGFFNIGKSFFLDISFPSQQKKQAFLKKGIRDFQNSTPFERPAYFFVRIIENLNVFNTVTLDKIFWITKTFFKKLKYSFLVENAF